jgi:hypothetical protein
MHQPKKTLLIEFSLTGHRTAWYAAAARENFEVLYVGTAAPDARFPWEQIGVGQREKPRNRLFQAAALRHALKHGDAGRWIAVSPPASWIVALAAAADRADVPLTLWLEETDTLGWFFYLVARAIGCNAEALFIEDGWELLLQQAKQAKEAA